MTTTESLDDYTEAITKRIDTGQHDHVATLDTPALTVTLMAVADLHHAVPVFSGGEGTRDAGERPAALLCNECSDPTVIQAITETGWTPELPGQVEHPCRTIDTMSTLLTSVYC